MRQTGQLIETSAGAPAKTVATVARMKTMNCRVITAIGGRTLLSVPQCPAAPEQRRRRRYAMPASPNGTPKP